MNIMDFCPECGSMIMSGSKCPMCGFDKDNSFSFQMLEIATPKHYISDKDYLKQNYDEFLKLIKNKNQIKFSKEVILSYFDKIIKVANEYFIEKEKRLMYKNFSNDLNAVNTYITVEMFKQFKSEYYRPYYDYFIKLGFDKRINNYNVSFIKKETEIIKDEFNELLSSRTNYIFKEEIPYIESKFKRPYCNYFIKLKMMDEINKFNNEIINKEKNKILDNLPDEYFSHSKMIQYQKENNLPFELDLIIEEHNDNFIKQHLKSDKDFFENIDGKSLDKNQIIAVLTDEDNTQIVAGAGTGKTLTLQAKIKYLIEKQGVLPEDILCMSFSNSAKDDLAKKLTKTIGNNLVDVRTFHSLGYYILGINGEDREVPKHELSDLIKSYFKESIENNPNLIKDFVEFFCYYFNVVHINSENLKLETIKSKLNALNEYDEFLSEYLQVENVRKTKEYVSNISELIISNFLFIHNIRYKKSKQALFKNKNYENQVNNFSNYLFDEQNDFIPNDEKLNLIKEFDDEFGDKLDCYPNFFLPDYDIYIKLLPFGPDWESVLDSEEKQKIKDNFERNNALNKKYKTQLFTIFDYGDDIESLLEHIHHIMQKIKIEVNELDYEQLFDSLILKNDLPEYNIFIKTVESFINLFKGNAQNIDENGRDISKEMFEAFKIENSEKFKNSFEKRNRFYLNLIEDIYELYKKSLDDNDYIDFNDMVNDAIIKLRNGADIHHYKYVIVDEYQDTSHTRYKLLKEVQNATGAKIVVVGDDWQSIYGFTGCDVHLFSQFENYFENTKRVTIDVTHRNSQQLLNVVGGFITENKKLIPKKLKSDYVSQKFPIKIYEYASRAYEVLALINILNEISEKKKDANVLILGRNNKDIYEISCKEIFEITQFNDYSLIEYNNCPELNIEFRTVHKSKGLEADYVVVLNLNNQIDGFPNKIVNDPILEFVNNKQSEDIDYAEERRLFYVALTRTKNEVYLFYKTKRPSQFILDIHNKEGVQYLDYTFSNNDVIYINSLLDKKFEVIETDNICPICKVGKVNLIINNKKRTSYFRCSNFCGWKGAKYHNAEYDDDTRKIEYVKYARVCSRCNSMLIVKRNSSDGSHFLGCAAFKDTGCRKTMSLTSDFNKSDIIELNIVDNLKGINKTRTGVYYMNDYVPEEKRSYYDDDLVDFSKRLIGYKNDNDDYSLNLFSQDLIKFIILTSQNKFNHFSKLALIAVPSSKVEKTNNSIKKSIDIIEKLYNNGELESEFDFKKEIINYKDLLKRIKDVPTAHLGEGRASCEEHIDSIECMQKDLSNEDTAYIVLDDITTTGDSMKACNEVLLENGVNAKNIFNIAIGATVWDENEEI